MYVLIVLTLFSLLVVCLCLSTGKSCQEKSDSGQLLYICCADYEERNGTCEACDLGFTSNSGEDCKRCPTDSYGLRCGDTCSCKSHQKCDNVLGCVDKHVTTIRVSVTSQEHTSIQSSKYSTERYFNNETESTTGLSYTSDISPTVAQENEGLSMREVVVYYTLSTAVLLLFIGLCYLYYKYRHVNKKQTITIRQAEMDNGINNDNIEMDDNVYEEIGDDNIMSSNEDETNKNTYLDVIAGSTSSESGDSANVEKSYSNNLLLDITDSGYKTKCALEKTINATMYANGEYENIVHINPYQPLAANRQKENHAYSETVATVHSARDSDLNNYWNYEEPYFNQHSQMARCYSYGYETPITKCINITRNGDENCRNDQVFRNISSLPLSRNCHKKFSSLPSLAHSFK